MNFGFATVREAEIVFYFFVHGKSVYISLFIERVKIVGIFEIRFYNSSSENIVFSVEHFSFRFPFVHYVINITIRDSLGMIEWESFYVNQQPNK